MEECDRSSSGTPAAVTRTLMSGPEDSVFQSECQSDYSTRRVPAPKPESPSGNVNRRSNTLLGTTGGAREAATEQEQGGQRLSAIIPVAKMMEVDWDRQITTDTAKPDDKSVSAVDASTGQVLRVLQKTRQRQDSLSEASTTTASKQRTISDPGSEFGDDMSPIARKELEDALHELARQVKPWSTGNFVFVRKLQEAARNKGRVDLMEVPSNEGKMNVAVKRMPNTWMQGGPIEFKKASPTSTERPWHDLGFVKLLNQRGFPYVCNLMGIFADNANTYVVSQFATHGDLFEWCNCSTALRPDRSTAREAVIKPLVIQIFGAVRWIHSLGVSHRDLSLENILLHEDDQCLQIKLVDFGMGTLKRWCKAEVRGKPYYQAPEMHEAGAYDAFLIDNFSLGVLVFAMAMQDYPWRYSQKNKCQLFEYFSTFGFFRFLERRKLRNGDGKCMIEVVSVPLAELLDGLLAVQPQDRLMLGERCWAHEEHIRRSVWDMAWLQ